MKTKTSELIGPALDWAAATAEGFGPGYMKNIDLRYNVSGKVSCMLVPINREYVIWSPSTNWAQGGPLMAEAGIGILFDAGSACRKPSWFATPDDQCTQSSYEGEQFDSAFMVDESRGMRGPTLLIAAMRCYVASKLGNEVEIPEELL